MGVNRHSIINKLSRACSRYTELGVLNYLSEQDTRFIISQYHISEWDVSRAEHKDRGIDELAAKLNEWYHMYY